MIRYDRRNSESKIRSEEKKRRALQRWAVKGEWAKEKDTVKKVEDTEIIGN